MTQRMPPSTPSRRSAAWMDRRRLGIALSAVLTVAAAVVFLRQVEVVTEAGEVRACGSALDSAVDRSGWEQWWVSDLDDTDRAGNTDTSGNTGTSGNTALTRTRLCPAAVNRQTMLAGVLGAIGVLIALAARRRRDSSTEPEPTSIEGRIRFLGNVAAGVGAGLTLAGIVALGVLVADADASLFRYTDRLVVAVGGLLVLTPAIALFAFGRLVGLVASLLGRRTPE